MKTLQEQFNEQQLAKQFNPEFKVKKKKEQDREYFYKQFGLFDMAHSHNYIYSFLIGSYGYKKGQDYKDGATSSVTGRELTPFMNRGTRKTRNGKRYISPKRDTKKHIPKSRKGSSSSHLGKNYLSHLVDDITQSAFLVYHRGKRVKKWLQSSEKDVTLPLRQRSKNLISKITIMCTRRALVLATRKHKRETEFLKNMFKTVWRSLKDNSDMLSAETICDELAPALANGDKKKTKIVRLTMGKTSKKKCIARALKISRPTLDARLKQIQLETPLQYVSEKMGTIAHYPEIQKQCAPISRKGMLALLKPVTIFKPAAPIIPLPSPLSPVLFCFQLEQREIETKKQCHAIKSRLLSQVIPFDNHENTLREQFAILKHAKQLSQAPSPILPLSSLCNEDTTELIRANYLNAIALYRAKHFPEYRRASLPLSASFPKKK